MNFTVPQFIEEESKIILFLTFKQIVIIGSSIAICVVLWFTIGNTFLFYILAFIVLLTGGSLALLKINKTPLPVMIKNYFSFVLKPKIYLWRKKQKQEFIPKEKVVKTIPSEKKKQVPLVKRSHIQSLFTQIESKK